MSDTAAQYPLEITDEILDQFDDVRRFGAANMFMRSQVRDIAEMMGCDALVDWHDRHGKKHWPVLLATFSQRVQRRNNAV